MNPDNGQTPLDYLNEISPEAPKKPIFRLNLRTIIIGAIILLILVIILVNVSSAIGNASKAPWQQFSARLTATAEIVDSSSDKIKNSQLRSLNSDLKLYITNTQRDLAKPLGELGINPERLPDSILKKESNEDMMTRLEDGRLNAKYDSTYAREMSYQLATLLALLQQLYKTNVGPQTKQFLNDAYSNLGPTYEAIADFSASNE